METTKTNLSNVENLSIENSDDLNSKIPELSENVLSENKLEEITGGINLDIPIWDEIVP
jgi:bacteriocin-like protein